MKQKQIYRKEDGKIWVKNKRWKWLVGERVMVRNNKEKKSKKMGEEV